MTAANELFGEVQQLLQQRRYRELSDRIGRILREDPASLSKSRITLGHLLVLGADWEAARLLLPKDTNSLETSGWLNSIANGKPVDRDGEPIPWFTYPAIDFLTQIMRPEWRVFEWGSGHSTLWWAKRVKAVASVEDDRAWYDKLLARMPENASLIWRGDAASYVQALAEQQARFDLVVIDGSHRNDCAQIVTEYVTDNGLIVFDNTDMLHHREGVEILQARGWQRIDFYGLIPSYYYKSCTSVFFRAPESLRPAVWPGGIASSVGPTCEQAIEAVKRSRA